MKFFKNLLFFTFLVLLFSSCSEKIISVKTDTIQKINAKIADEITYSQEPKDYLNNIEFFDQITANKNFDDKYFKVWHIDKLSISKEEATWGNMYASKKIYLQNHTIATKQWFDKQLDNSFFDTYNFFKQKAIVIKNSNLRVFPTNEPMFYDPKKAGEGYPFDYNQNSYIKINTPIIISHFSKDKKWVFVEAYSTFGWIKVEHIAFVNKNFISLFENDNYFVATKDKFDIYDEYFIDKIQLGTIFPKNNLGYLVAKKNSNHQAILKIIQVNDKFISKKPLYFSKTNISKIADEFIGSQYGWGGLLGFRDCSSFTQDFFTTFGLYLNRNSYAQTKNGNYLDMSKLTKEKKKEFIIKNGVPFLTLVYLKGHIMLYIGSKNNEPLVMHSVWGVRTKTATEEPNRYIIGKNIISTLEFGKELETYDNTETIIDKIQGIVILNK